ncbi:hypothetical protein NNO_0511 [Hydrogenimonas sp.]|nr:hypothetical protein NNO_0511 [Hydrogenimonas sp.]
MTLLFLLIAAAAGVVVLIYEIKLREENLRKLKNYLAGLVHDGTLTDREKLRRVIELFSENGYAIDDMKSGFMVVSRREFSVGAALLWFAVGGVGLLIYLIYYFLKKPRRLNVDLNSGEIGYL